MREFAEQYLSYSQSYVVAVDEVDFNERLKPSAVLQYFQDLATAHADLLGIGFSAMLKKGVIWVVTNISVKYFRYPEIGEKITVTTFPRKPSVAYALRDYYITDESGNVIISGTSKWVTIDAKNRMIRRCNVLFDYPDSAYMPNSPFDDGNEIISITENTAMDSVMSDKVRVSDLDRNGHMNNARYGDVILNSFPLDFLSVNSIGRFDVNFVSEMKYGDEFETSVSTTENRSVLMVTRAGGTVFRARIDWQKK